MDKYVPRSGFHKHWPHDVVAVAPNKLKPWMLYGLGANRFDGIEGSQSVSVHGVQDPLCAQAVIESGFDHHGRLSVQDKSVHSLLPAICVRSRWIYKARDEAFLHDLNLSM